MGMTLMLAMLAAAAPPATAAPAKPRETITVPGPVLVSAADQLVCKRFLDTGSLVRETKRCFTRAQWDKIAETERRGWEKTRDGLSER